MTLSIMTLSITTFSITVNKTDNEHNNTQHCYVVSFMLSVIMLMDTLAVFSLGQRRLKVTNALAYYFKAIMRKEKKLYMPRKKSFKLTRAQVADSEKHTSLLCFIKYDKNKT
jgi:hypothetical protein